MMTMMMMDDGGARALHTILPLYLGGIAWTMVYDTIYAHQDRSDDAQLGLKSTALTFGERNTQSILSGFATISLLSWCYAGYIGAGYDHGGIMGGGGGDDILPLYCMGIGTAYAHLMWQIRTMDFGNNENLAYRFKSNNVVGAIVYASIVAGNATSLGITVM